MVRNGDAGVTIAYAGADDIDRLPEIVDGARPQDLRWGSLTIGAPSTALLGSEAGLVADLRDISTNVTFAQVYLGACNPASSDFSACWLYESYKAGDPGLTGTLTLRLSEDVTGSIDVTWERLTDRFGDPIQWHRHGTLSDFQIPIVGDAQ